MADENKKPEVKKPEVKPVVPVVPAPKAEVVEVEKLGIKETKDMILFLAKLGVSVAQCAVNKKFRFTYFIDDIAKLPAALAGITEVPKEVKDLDSAEIKELLDVVMVELAPLGITTGEAAKKFVSAGINFAEGIIDLLAGFKATKSK